MSAMANAETGYRCIQQIGNMNQENSWIIRNLEPKTYYWSVQAIDHAFAGSQFGIEQSFSITATAVAEITQQGELEIWPNPVVDHVTVNIPGNDVAEIIITSLQGKRVAEAEGTGNITIDLSSQPGGMYIISVYVAEKQHIQKILK
jgi:hypothetical protein